MECFIGMIMPWPVNFAPSGWAFCQGQSLSVAQNSALYALIGNTYGGNTTNFNLPNLCGRMIIGTGLRPGSQVNYSIGTTGGNEAVTIQPANMPVHNHAFSGNSNVTMSNISVSVAEPAFNGPADSASPSSTTCLAQAGNINGEEIFVYSNNAPDVTLISRTATGTGTGTATVSGTTGNAGTGTAINTVSPYIAMNYIIALTGLFPMRD